MTVTPAFAPMLSAQLVKKAALQTNDAVITALKGLRYPVYVSGKIDGIRCIIHPTRGPVSRKILPIPNEYIRKQLDPQKYCRLLYLDGELVVLSGDSLADANEAGKKGPAAFQTTTSGVMSQDGTPNFAYFVFDRVAPKDRMYANRLADAELAVQAHRTALGIANRVHIVPYEVCIKPEQVLDAEMKYLEMGYEGIMIRSPSGGYKYGRSTLREGGLIKLKRFEDAEAEIIGFEPKYHNANALQSDELGYAKRSSHKANLQALDTLGALVVKGINGEFQDVQFNIGTGAGLDDGLRSAIWRDRNLYLGRVVTYRYQSHGSKDAPRIPIFKGFRDD